MPHVLAENIDRLMTLELRPGSGNLPTGIVNPLYEAVRATGAEPLTLRGARGLLSATADKKEVFILTGAGAAPYLPKAEVDGIIGSVILARTLIATIAAQVTILTESRAREPMEAAIRASGYNVWDAGIDATAPQSNSIGWLESPLAREACEAQAAALITDKTAAVVAIEKLSPNEAGIIHGATGLDYHADHSKPDVYIDRAKEMGAYTCGIGDNGNEVGFGVVADAVREVMPAGRDCGCPCGKGSAAATVTDDFLVAAISNWGAYGLAAMVAHLHGDLRTLLTPGDLDRILRATVDAGALCGGTARPTLTDDAVPYEGQMAYAAMLNCMVTQANSHLESPGH